MTVVTEPVPSRRDFERLEAKVDRLFALVGAQSEKIAESHVTKEAFEGHKALNEEIHKNQNAAITALQGARDKVVIFVLAAVGAAILSVVLVQTGVV